MKEPKWDSINVSFMGKTIQVVPFNSGTKENFCYKCEDSKLFEFKENIYGCDKCKSTYKITGDSLFGSFEQLT